MTPQAIDLVVTKWGAHYRGRSFPCAIGRGGIGDKHGEGDGITPRGTWRIAGVAFRADRRTSPSSVIPYSPIGPADIWSDDPNDAAYNHRITARGYKYSAERLFRSDPLYDLIAVLDYNWPEAVSGKGSAIFLHSWRAPRHKTAGCVAFQPNVLCFILETWQPRARVVVRGG